MPWYNCDIFKKRRRYPHEIRKFFISHDIHVSQTVGDGVKHMRFRDNKIVSSKYTFWNFIPKNLFEQFRRLANLYFLIVAIIQLLIDSPVSPLTTWLPLVFVVTVTAVKQGYEDFLRNRRDREVNLQTFEIVRDGRCQSVRSQDIHVGDIVCVWENESFPCDLILLSSCNKEGKCHITTANLDGETNLKIKHSPIETRLYDSAPTLSELKGEIHCENPTTDLYKFTGKLHLFHGESEISLNIDNVLLRGARLKDTEFIFGCAVYTGQDTKLALNSKLTSNKFSTVEKSMNAFLIVMVVILILEITVCTGLKYLTEEYLVDAWYLQPVPEISVSLVFQDLFAFVAIFSYTIPISLYVTIELQKFFGSLFFQWDSQLYCSLIDEGAICNSSDLNEELGQVEYLLSDKTGTLTENIMQFRQCSIGGVRYLEKDEQLMKFVNERQENAEPVSCFTVTMEMFLVTLALCHTVHVSNKPRKPSIDQESFKSPKEGEGLSNPCYTTEYFDYDYQASSPDEKALVEACRRLNIVYHGEKNNIYNLTVFGEERFYKRLQVFEFDSARKRMSVVFEFPDGSLWLLCKGAETAILPKCIAGPIEETQLHINTYAMLGLRTLTIAARRLSLPEYQDLNTKLQQARSSLVNREEAVSQVFEQFETNLTLLGATGVEDKLQDGVQETLSSLRAAGIKIWILTGDKLETAVNIAHSCGHFTRAMEEINLSDLTEENCAEILSIIGKRVYENPSNNYGLVIDGHTLTHVLKEPYRSMFSSIAVHCYAVVCCRMSPIQKAEVVKMVKSFHHRPITAAIGDGANDVSMIQEAHVGLGIMGKEGRQAVRCSDFAFARFRFLSRVLLVHGHWYYWRVSTLVQYFFYKNIVFNSPILFFTFFSAFSTQSVYDSILLTLFNTIFTALPIMVFGLLEQNFSDVQLLKHLHLYRNIAKNAKMNWWQFFKWNAQGFWHGIVIYVGAHLLLTYQVDIFTDGTTMDLAVFGTILCRTIVIIVNIKLLLESRYWSVPYILSIVLSQLIGFSAVVMAYNAFYIDFLENGSMVWVYIKLLTSGSCWILLLLTIVICLIPDIIVTTWETYSFGSDVFIANNVVPEGIFKRKLERIMSHLTQSRRGTFDIDSRNVELREFPTNPLLI